MSSSDNQTTLLPGNIFVPRQYQFANPVKLTNFEKVYIKLIMQIAEEYIANNTMNLVITGWYNVTFDNYPSLRALLPANYTDTIVGLAGQITIAIQDLVPNHNKPLEDQFIPIGRRHYMHGTEAVTMLCASPCLVQSMYNLLVSTGERIVGLIESILAHPNLMTLPLQNAGLVQSEEVAVMLLPAEQELWDAFIQTSGLESTNGEEAPEESFNSVTSVTMVSPLTLTLGETSTKATIGNIAETLSNAFKEDEALVKRLFTALQALPESLKALLQQIMNSLLDDLDPDKERRRLELGLITGTIKWGDLDEKQQKNILNGVVEFLLRFVLPVILIPFGRFVDTMVDIITAGLRTEQSVRMLNSWKTNLEDRREEFARRFWWQLLENTPDVRFSLGLQTSTLLQQRMDYLTKELAAALEKYFPRITDGGLEFKNELMKMGETWNAAGFPIDGYDGVRQAFLLTVNSMLFASSPVYARTLPAIRLKTTYEQLASVVLTEFIYGAGGNRFNAVGGLLGMPANPPAASPAPIGSTS